MDRLLLFSYNSTGLGQDKVDYIQHFIQSHTPDFFLLQETWLLSANVAKLACFDSNYMFHGVSGVNDSELLRGRPYGGVAILWHKKWNRYVKRVNVPGSNRIYAVILECGQLSLLIACCYLPCETYSSHVSDEFVTVMDAIECLRAQYLCHAMIIGGDFNIDTKRNTSHVNYFLDMVERCAFIDQWQVNVNPNRFTYCDFFHNAFTCIDRWLTVPELRCLEAGVVHEGTNPSKHNIITLQVEVNTEAGSSSCPSGPDSSSPGTESLH